MSLQGQVLWSALVAAGIVAACFSPTAGAAVQGTADPAAAADSPAPPEAVFRNLEERLLGTPAWRLRYTITAEGAVAASLSGTLQLADSNQVELHATGTFAGAPATLHLRSDGRRMDGGSAKRTFTAATPPELRESVIIGLTRMGLLHTLARLTGGTGSDHATGGVQEWVRVKDLTGEKADAVGPAEFRQLRFAIFVSGERSGTAMLRIHRDSGLPERREQTVALNDVSNQPVSPELAGRIQSLGAALRQRLATACGYQVVPADSLAQAPAETASGYLYAHPDVAVGAAASAHAEWVVIPRLNRASPWVTDLQAQVVRTRDTTLVSNRIVEVKGIELTPELAAKLIDRGAAWMADQVSQAIDHTPGASSPTQRRCPA
jgi:hypothetical protein